MLRAKTREEVLTDRSSLCCHAVTFDHRFCRQRWITLLLNLGYKAPHELKAFLSLTVESLGISDHILFLMIVHRNYVRHVHGSFITWLSCRKMNLWGVTMRVDCYIAGGKRKMVSRTLSDKIIRRQRFSAREHVESDTVPWRSVQLCFINFRLENSTASEFSIPETFITFLRWKSFVFSEPLKTSSAHNRRHINLASFLGEFDILRVVLGLSIIGL
jgi:hypothetical protein